MKTVKKTLLLVVLFFASNTRASADSSPVSLNRVSPVTQPVLKIIAETVRVNVKNRMTITKILLVLKNPADSAILTAFNFPLSKKDARVDFGVSRRSEPINSSTADSPPPLAALAAFAESSDSASAGSQASLVQLAPARPLL